MKSEPLEPVFFAIGAFCMTPVVALLLIALALLFLIAWPFLPFLCYMQRREEIMKERDHDGDRVIREDEDV